MDHVSKKILSTLDVESLANAELVSTVRRETVQDLGIWKPLVQRKVQFFYFLINIITFTFFQLTL